MFKKFVDNVENLKPGDNVTDNNYSKTDDNIKKDNNGSGLGKGISNDISSKIVSERTSNGKINTILKGSKVTGDINITCDLELSGEIEGNITSKQNSNIVIKGVCKGNVETGEGNVDIEGELEGGNITAGRNVSILGKFNGGEIKANGKIYINGEFNGKLECNEVEIGPNAQGKGELFYKNHISISRGAKIEAQITQLRKEPVVENASPENNVVDIKLPVKKELEAKG